MTTSYARVETPHASEYLARLSGGFFAKTRTLMRTDNRAVIALPNASCELWPATASSTSH